MHLTAAEQNAKSCIEIEKGISEKDIEILSKNTAMLRDNIQGFSSSCVINSVAFLESVINELIEDASDNILDNIDVKYIEKMRALFDTEILEKASILDKYQMVLIIFDKEPFIKGNNPYQDTASLIYLRNRLVHSKITWQPLVKNDKEFEKDKIQKLLENKFKDNRIFKDTNFPYFPEKCLGAGCSEWSVHIAKQFITNYFNIIGISDYQSRFTDVWGVKK